MPGTPQTSANGVATADPPPVEPDPYMTDLIQRLSDRLGELTPGSHLPKPSGTPAEKALDLAQRLAQARATLVGTGTGTDTDAAVGKCHFIRGGKECFVNATRPDCAAMAMPASFDWSPGQVAQEGWFEPVAGPPPG